MSRLKRKLPRYQYGGQMQEGSNILSGATKGAGIGLKVVGPTGAAIGAVGGALPGLGEAAYNNNKLIRRITDNKLGRIALTGFNPVFGIGANRARKAAEAEEEMQRKNFQNQLAMDAANSANILATYPTQGIRGVSSFRYGGRMLGNGGRVMKGG